MLGEAGLLRIAKLLGEVPAEKVIPSLLKEIGERFPENLAADDVTLLVVRANGGALDYTFREKLDAFGRFLKTFFASLNPRADRAPFPDAKLANVGGAIIPALGRRWRAPRPPQKPFADDSASARVMWSAAACRRFSYARLASRLGPAVTSRVNTALESSVAAAGRRACLQNSGSKLPHSTWMPDLASRSKSVGDGL
jgi:hypothetical protein